jgi:Fe(3+) dicitrate transport protein
MEESIYELPGVVIERVTLTGGSKGLQDIPGSAHYITPKKLDQFSYNDINRTLKNIPGINLQEEDGFGLRPNIGMRGTGVERSSKITVMEDGVLAAPAPYAAPAAYFFPTVGRMHGIEVRKGSSQIKYGPFTTGGALNLISTPIPDEFSGRLSLLAGSFGQVNFHGHVGQSFEQVGFMVETFQSRADGFKDLDNGGDTGFDVQDFLAKVSVNTKNDAKIYQSLTFKFAYNDQTSNETYLGFTDEDFDETQYRRYAGSQVDVMNTERTEFKVQHLIKPMEFLDVTTTLYRTDFSRNWYKLQSVQQHIDSASVGIDDILADPQSFSNEYQVVSGNTGSFQNNVLAVRANNREYYARGVQTVLGLRFEGPTFNHDIELGIRVHEDQMDRFQWEDDYRLLEGTMRLIDPGVPGTQSNRIETANAVATFAQYTLRYNRLLVVPGIRYENIKIRRDDFGNNDPQREGTDLTTRENKVDVFIPGIGLDYKLNNSLNLFAGVHRGFSPPGSSEGTEPEKSINYEIGSRLNYRGISITGLYFLNDYDNLLGSDLAAAGGAGTTDQFNGGRALIQGIELEAFYDLTGGNKSAYRIPLNLSYTFTDSRFQNSFESDFEPWGTVDEGDELPYLSRHQLAFNVGFESKRFDLHVNGKYNSAMRTLAGQGEIISDFSIGSNFVTDISASYRINNNFKIFGLVNNLTNEVYEVSRRPAGLRPGLPQSFMGGIKANF